MSTIRHTGVAIVGVWTSMFGPRLAHGVSPILAGLPAVLADDAKLVIYGPFNYGGQFTSASNAQFNETLKGWGAHMAIRDFEAVDALARGIGLRLIEDRAMPANNRCLVWEK